MNCFLCSKEIGLGKGTAMPGDMWVCETCQPKEHPTQHPTFKFTETARVQHPSKYATLVVTLEIPIKDYTQLLLYKK